jgi:hypothetical protein
MALDTIVETHFVNLGQRWNKRGFTVQLELVRCGKSTCHALHGPYWYAYRRRPRSTMHKRERLIKVYVGRFRDDAKAEQLLRQRGAL